MNSSDLNLFSSKKRTLQCKNCSANFESYLEDKLYLFQCNSCLSVNNVRENSYTEKKSNKLNSQIFEIGDEGEFKNKKYRITSVTAKRNLRNATDKWTEFCLIDTDGKLSYLNRSYGSYTWVKDEVHLSSKIDFSKEIPDNIQFEGREYKFFIRYRLHQSFFMGELPYDCDKERSYEFADFTCPPYVLSVELNSNKEQTAFHGEHISRKNVSKMFNNQLVLEQTREGYGMAMPFLYGLNAKKFALTNLIICGIMLLFNLFYDSTIDSKQLLYDSYDYSDGTIGDAKNEYVSPSFTINDDIPNYLLDGTVQMSLSNQWAEFVFSLVNEQTGEEREFTRALEYWSGVDNGYAWSEGNTINNFNLSSVKPGRYHLRTKVYADPGIMNSSFSIRISTGHSGTWNFYFLGISGVSISLILLFFFYRFERVRTGQLDSLLG